jgi:hypothetical protein
VKDTDSEIRIECDLAADLPIAPDELKLLQELLPDLVKEMVWAQPEE